MVEVFVHVNGRLVLHTLYNTAALGFDPAKSVVKQVQERLKDYVESEEINLIGEVVVKAREFTVDPTQESVTYDLSDFKDYLVPKLS